MTLKDPFEPYTNADRCHTSIDIPRSFQAYLNSLYPIRGALQVTVALLLVKLKKLLQQQGLTEYDPDEYARIVTESELTLGGGTVANSPSKADSRNDAGRTDSTPSNPPGLPAKSDGVASRPTRKKTSKAKGGKAKD